MKNIGIILFCLLFLLQACGDKNPCWDGKNLLLNVKGTINNQDFALNQAFENVDGETVDFSSARFYLSNISLIKDDFTEVDVTDVLLRDFTFEETHDFDIPAGTYQSIKMGIGLNPEQNAQDPAIFDAEHPMSYNQNTYWTWSTQYKFVMLEGNIEKEGASKTFSYHTGTDTLYRTIELPQIFTLYDDKRTQVDLNIDFDRVFQNINMFEENFTHTTPATFNLSYKLTQNFKEAIN